MTYCETCRVLKHASADANPPATLAVNAIMDRLDGALCTYTCTVCGSTWMRFRANQLYSGRLLWWQAMS